MLEKSIAGSYEGRDLPGSDLCTEAQRWRSILRWWNANAYNAY
jgi:hypothetical protein